MTDEDTNSIVPKNDRIDMAFDATAALTNLVPFLGGVIASVISGVSTER